MAYSVAIVDDEKLVTFGIKAILSEEGSPFQVIGSWYNGREALRHCLSTPPDLLLTDICMPGMDGLDLIQELRKNNSSTKIVVLSCHDEYAMVHKAFLLGADDYILKQDIDKENLYKILSRLLPENKSSRIGKDSVKALSQLPDIDAQEVLPKGIIGVMGFKREFDDTDSEILWKPNFSMLFQIVQECLGQDDQCYLGTHDDLVIHLPGGDIVHTDPRLEKIRSTVSRYINRRVYIAQYVFINQSSLMEEYENSRKILKSMFYTENSTILVDEVTKSACRTTLVFPLTTSQFEDCWFGALNDFLSEAKEKLIDPGSVKDEVIFALKLLLHRLQENRGNDFIELQVDDETPYYRRIDLFDDMEQLRSWVMKLLMNIIQYIKGNSRLNSQINGIKNFVSEHLDENLRLISISEIFNMNANYLSSIFKKETGESYIDYVNSKRIDKACELLETTDLSAKEIAYRCGYQNPNYFSRIFKKIAGKTISDYRYSRNR